MGKTIGLIGGTGKIGQGLALRWGLARESVIIGSRKKEKASIISQQINERIGEELVIPKTNAVCVEESEIIILTVPFEHLIDTITPIIGLLTENHIIVDVTVPLKPFRKGKMVDVLSESELGAKSATELLRNHIPPEIPIVGAFKTVSNTILLDTNRVPTLNQDIYIFGSNKSVKRVISDKVKLIKFLKPVDGGSILSARHIEHFTAFLIGLNRRYKTHDCGFSVTRLIDKAW